MESLPEKVMLQTILEMDSKDIQNLCASNKMYNTFCKNNKVYIYKKLLERDYPFVSNEDTYKILKRSFCTVDDTNSFRSLIRLLDKSNYSSRLSDACKFFYYLFNCYTYKKIPRDFAERLISNIKENQKFFMQKEEVWYNTHYEHFKKNPSSWSAYKANTKYYLKHSDEWIKKLESI